MKACTQSELQAFFVDDFYFRLLRIISAPITPGTQPHSVSRKIIRKLPQPLSSTAKGGNTIARITRNILIV